MNPSRSFDRAASIYDQTRPLLEPIAKHGLQAILDITGLNGRILDVGTGTGRISIPLLERGVDLIGCDLSAKMLRRLQEKFPPACLAQSDASLLPFPARHFDALLMVHVMHLIPPWREALSEFRQVLVPGGVYLNVRTWEPVGISIRAQMRDFWRGWLEAQGVNARQPGAQDGEQFLQELRSLGAHLTEMEVIRYPLTFTLGEELESFVSRVYSNTWNIPDAIFDASLEELRAWVEREYGDLDGQLADEVRFAMDVARFEG
jgi:ubiquinone/menaquinone biosynthesis C-methylase UbiE